MDTIAFLVGMAMLDWRFDFSVSPSECYTIDHVGPLLFVHCLFRQPYLFYVFTWRVLACFTLMRPECLSRPYARVERLSSFIALAFGDCACLTSEKE